MFYDDIVKNRQMYIAEGYKQLHSYININRRLEPWYCREFCVDQQLVEEYARRFPRAKGSMREFAARVYNYTCRFVWSDSKPITEYSYDWPYTIDDYQFYVIPRTDEELGKDKKAAKLLRKLTRAPSAGGISISKTNEYDLCSHIDPEYESKYKLERIKLRCSLKDGKGGILD